MNINPQFCHPLGQGECLHLASTRFTCNTEISNEDETKAITTEDPKLETNIKKFNTCDQCKYKTTVIENLKRHTESKQEEISYPCNLCNNTANNINDLGTHVESKHKESDYHCEQIKHHPASNTHMARNKEVECALCTRLLKLGDTCVCKRLLNSNKQYSSS